MMLSEEEFQTLPKGGNRDQKSKKERTNSTNENIHTKHRDHKSRKDTKNSTDETSHRKPHRLKKETHGKTMEENYCQPTSSEIKVEDLITDDEEQKQNEELDKNPIDDNNDLMRKKSFWDRPTPPPQFEWVPDPRMPSEWNAVIADMRTSDWTRFRPEGEFYRSPKDEEISESVEFTGKWFPDQKERERLHAQSTMRLETSVEEWTTSIKKLRDRFDEPKICHRKPPERKPDKGKGKATELSEEDYPRLRQQWHDEYYELVQGVKEVLPPFREVNHEIHLVDENKRYTYHLPRCPTSLRGEFYEKLNRYVDAGWWEAKSCDQAAPMMCLPKKDGRLRTVVDARQRNDNTVKDVTPLPDQDVIREDVARGKIRSKIDLSDAYEQVRVRPQDVHKTAFATIAGTMVSNVVQIGDCNAPATFQRLMTSIFRDAIGRFMHVYLDDIFIFSDTIEEHEKHLKFVFEKLRVNQLFLKWKKCELYADKIDCLGHVIDDQGIHPAVDKLERIREWRVPRNYNDIQRFVGLVNYVGNFLPNISAYTGPLLAMTMNGAPFHWRPLHQRCFDMIKRICCKTPIIRPIDQKVDEPIWIICDASKTGVGAMYGQGPSWQQCRPAGFMSKKFTSAQQNYAVHELETLAILEALIKWEDKLVGNRLHVITDHKALEFFKTQANLSHRQRRWTDYMSRFDFDITYIKGELNKVADCLSRYYENDTSADIHAPQDYVRADVRIDPNGDDLPIDRYNEVKQRVVEIRAQRAEERRRSKRLSDKREEREREAHEMKEADQPSSPDEQQRSTNATAGTSERIEQEEITLGDVVFGRSTLPGPNLTNDDEFIVDIKKEYHNDKIFSVVLDKPSEHPTFHIKDGIIWRKNSHENNVTCIPRNRAMITKIITQAHEIVGHFGDQRTAEYIRRWYWWPQITKDVHEFCRTCEACQRSKTSTQAPAGKLHSLPIPTKPWDSIGMDFIGPFPESRGFNYLWVIICRMTSMVHLIPVNTTTTASELSWIYLREIVRLHGLPSSIVSDRDSKFTSKWWRELHKLLGAKLLMSTSFHPQTDGQTERANKNVGQIFRTLVHSNQKNWVDKVALTEFAINASISETTKYAPFELNGGYMPSMLREIRQSEGVAKGIKAFAQTALENLAEAHDAIIEARTLQTHASNKHRGKELELKTGELVYLSTKNLNLAKSRARKLCPKFIGPYKILKAYEKTSTYTLQLPTALQSRRIHPTFHASLLKPYRPSDDALFPNRTQPEPYDFGAEDDQEWFVDDILGHRWTKDRRLEYEVRWTGGDTTWEPHAECKNLEALDRYLELQGVARPSQLAKRA
jgi:hypothetical protein